MRCTPLNFSLPIPASVSSFFKESKINRVVLAVLGLLAASVAGVYIFRSLINRCTRPPADPALDILLILKGAIIDGNISLLKSGNEFQMPLAKQGHFSITVTNRETIPFEIKAEYSSEKSTKELKGLDLALIRELLFPMPAEIIASIKTQIQEMPKDELWANYSLAYLSTYKPQNPEASRKTYQLPGSEDYLLLKVKTKDGRVWGLCQEMREFTLLQLDKKGELTDEVSDQLPERTFQIAISDSDGGEICASVRNRLIG